MSSSQGNSMPKDSQIIISIMNDLGIREYEQQVLNHLLEFNYRYTSLILEDAKACSTFANKDEVDVDDVKMAIQLAQDNVFNKLPSRDEIIKAGNELNKTPLPAIKPASGLRIPRDGSNFIQANYRLRTDLNTGKNVMTKSTKITAAEMLNATRQTEDINNTKTTAQPDLIMDDLTDIDIDEIIGSQQDNQDIDNDFNLDSLLCDPNSLFF
ncbi:transcription initiation factor TFIID subunit 9-like [Melanaphis sacchari]|uniref:Transcription initiation factor TFIID subunit 9 n=1 Tax=Melanaphis sacchari TaxID=742174 RepID=A0A2H8TV77_9HEMI|nr:transcription initiation factor TFIID subunit 9-like [Melanaphis sacchari]